MISSVAPAFGMTLLVTALALASFEQNNGTEKNVLAYGLMRHHDAVLKALEESYAPATTRVLPQPDLGVFQSKVTWTSVAAKDSDDNWQVLTFSSVPLSEVTTDVPGEAYKISGELVKADYTRGTFGTWTQTSSGKGTIGGLTFELQAPDGAIGIVSPYPG